METRAQEPSTNGHSGDGQTGKTQHPLQVRIEPEILSEFEVRLRAIVIRTGPPAPIRLHWILPPELVTHDRTEQKDVVPVLGETLSTLTVQFSRPASPEIQKNWPVVLHLFDDGTTEVRGQIVQYDFIVSEEKSTGAKTSELQKNTPRRFGLERLRHKIMH